MNDTTSQNFNPDGSRCPRKRQSAPEQHPLLDYAETPKETRAAAFHSSKPKRAERCRQLLEWLVSRGNYGATAYEASEAMEWPYTSMQSLLLDLKKDGKIRYPGTKRPTQTRHPAAVAVAVGAEVSP